MRKFVALGLSTALVLSMTACGGSGTATTTAAETTAATTEAEKATVASTEKAVETETAAAVSASGEYYPGGTVQYKDGDPAPNVDQEITSTEKVEWTIAACLTESNPQSQALQKIADELEEKTNGNFKWDIFFNSELGSESEAVELVRNNTAQFVTSNVTVMSTYVDEYSVFALPYVFHKETDLLSYLQDSDKAKQLYQKLEDEVGLVTLGFNCTGTRCLSTNKVPIAKSPADFKGIKIRSMEAQVWQNVIESLGGTPVPIAFTELYTALQTGVVQGQDNPIANTVDGKFYEVLDTFYENDHAFLVSGYYSNPDSWNALPDDYKALLEGLMAKYMGDYYHEEITKFQGECKKIMEDAGVTFVSQDQLDMQAFYDAADAMIQEKYMSNDTYKNFIDDVKATFNY